MSTSSIPQTDGEFDSDSLLDAAWVGASDTDERQRSPGDTRSDTDTDTDTRSDTDERQRSDTGGDTRSDTAEFWRSAIFTAAEFANRPPKAWLIDGLLGVGDIAQLFGESGSAKTFATLDLAFSLMTGRTFAKRFSVARPATVCYFTNEGHAGLGARLRAAMHYYSPSPDELNRLRVVDRAPQLFERGLDASASTLVNAWPSLAEFGLVPQQPDLIVIDTLFGAAVGAEENSSKDFGRIFDSCAQLRRALGCCVLLVHHTDKSGNKYRGSSAQIGEMDSQIKTAKAGRGRFILSCEKLKDGEPFPAQGFDLVSVGTDSVRVDWTGDAVNRSGERRTNADRVVEFLEEHAGESFTAADICAALSLAAGNANNLYRDLRQLKLAGTVREEKVKGEPARFAFVAT